MKLGVIVPYRKRPTHLRKFQEHIQEYLKDYDYELIVVDACFHGRR
jgi:glycosyltransferase involved in cell wall biosynthesis